MNRPKRMTTDNIERWTSENIERFGNRLSLCPHPNIREDECRGYLDIWTSIREKGHDWNLLSKAEKNELLDCYYEEYER